MAQRDSMSDAGYTYGGYSKRLSGHILVRKDDGRKELWFANKGHASYGIKWGNTDLEFARSVADTEV